MRSYLYSCCNPPYVSGERGSACFHEAEKEVAIRSRSMKYDVVISPRTSGDFWQWIDQSVYSPEL
jgi:hypothetical protein